METLLAFEGAALNSTVLLKSPSNGLEEVSLQALQPNLGQSSSSCHR